MNSQRFPVRRPPQVEPADDDEDHQIYLEQSSDRHQYQEWGTEPPPRRGDRRRRDPGAAWQPRVSRVDAPLGRHALQMMQGGGEMQPRTPRPQAKASKKKKKAAVTPKSITPGKGQVSAAQLAQVAALKLTNRTLGELALHVQTLAINVESLVAVLRKREERESAFDDDADEVEDDDDDEEEDEEPTVSDQEFIAD